MPTPAPTATPIQQSQTPVQAPTSTQLVSRKYQWSYEGSTWTWELQFPEALYDYYKALPRPPAENYSVYVTHPYDDKSISAIADKIRQAAKQQGYSEYETVSFAAAFVQNLPYTSDSVTTGYDEYPRYPIETLVDNGGDCEDTSILMASLLDALAYGAVLLVFPGSNGASGHCAVGVKGGEGVYGSYWEYGGQKYYYLETTGTGWTIGEAPPEYENALANIYPMIPVPILTHTWTSKGNGTYIELQVTVSNLGSAAAQNIYVFAGFDAGNNQCWNSQESPTFQLGVNESIVATLNLVPPYGNQHTRIMVQIVYDGYAVDESYSTWFDT